MNRSELVAALADRAEVTRKDADAVLAALAETVGEIVAKGDEKVTIPGFLTFERTHRAAPPPRPPRPPPPPPPRPHRPHPAHRYPHHHPPRLKRHVRRGQ